MGPCEVTKGAPELHGVPVWLQRQWDGELATNETRMVSPLKTEL